MKGLVIIGGGGHGKVIADAAEASGQWNQISFLDDSLAPGASVGIWSVLGTLSSIGRLGPDDFDVAVAVGDNRRRMEIVSRVSALGYRLPVIVHPTAYVSQRAVIGSASVVLTHAAVLVGSRLGAGCIVNTGASVDHDCIVGDGVHLSPGARLAGGVRVSECVWLGMGSSTIAQVSIGSNAVVGAGSVVLKDVPAESTIAGVPAVRISPDWPDE